MMNTTAITKRMSRYSQMSKKPEPLIITSLMARMNHLAGNMLASTWNIIGMLFNGNRNPDSSTVGRNRPIMVIIMASTCVRLMEEISIPKEAAVSMKMMHRNSSINRLPLMGILNTVTLMTKMAMVLMNEIIM